MQSITAHALPYNDAFCEVPTFGICGKRNQNLGIPPHAANAVESTQPDPDIPGLGSDLVGTRIQVFLPDLSQGNVGNLFDFPAEIIPALRR